MISSLSFAFMFIALQSVMQMASGELSSPYSRLVSEIPKEMNLTNVQHPIGSTRPPPTPGTPPYCNQGAYVVLFADPSRDYCAWCPAGTTWSQDSPYGYPEYHCTPCPAGYIASNPGSSSCTPCSAGSYQITPATVCVACPVGSAQPSSGSTDCPLCPVGTMAPVLYGAVNCVNCNAGTYSSSAGSTACNNCSVGTYSPSSAYSSCLSCPSATNPGMSYCP